MTLLRAELRHNRFAVRLIYSYGCPQGSAAALKTVTIAFGLPTLLGLP
ncbi:MAG: hypothetical protein H0X66_08325 [Verrucomicrobia bacterium]|nr:hypothetical protein [Verrucomicrobiota bacterium]